MNRGLQGLLVLSFLVPYAWAAPTTVTSTQSTQSQAQSAEQTNARYWNLSVDEYRRSQALMRGVRGSFSDLKITPLEVLGIHATNDAERRKYAEMFARLMAEDTARVLAFQNEYQQAFARLYPNLHAIDLQHPTTLLSPQKKLSSIPSIPTAGIKAFSSSSRITNTAAMSQPSKLTAGDRLLVFTSQNCASCNIALKRALSRASSVLPVDVFVVAANSEADVQRYAQSVGIAPGMVQSGVVTLNLDRGTFSKVLPWKPDLPQVVRRRGMSLQQLLVSDLY
jgi:integrating conjugative element protein (TIGR03759 family)